MRAAVQRVLNASVSIDGDLICGIGAGILVLVGFNKDDTVSDFDYIAKKCVDLRIFDDDNGVMNISLADMHGEILIVSQFTLYGDARKGRRPSYFDAAPPGIAKKLYDDFLKQLGKYYSDVKSGVFGADMQVSLVNDGPVTILLDSKKEF